MANYRKGLGRNRSEGLWRIIERVWDGTEMRGCGEIYKRFGTEQKWWVVGSDRMVLGEKLK